MGTCSVVYTFGITEYTWVCRGRPFVFVTLDGSFFLYCDVLILIYLSMGRVLDVLHCNIKRYKSKTTTVTYRS